jgi:phosphatidylglycerophosphate synthase
MVLSIGATAVTGSPVWVVLVGMACLAGLTLGSWRRWTASGRFGWANTSTLLRLGLVAWMPAVPGGRLGVASTAMLVLVLDAADGWLARRFGTAGPFGARFDMETDAWFVAVLGAVLAQSTGLGAWALVPGLWRYIYVLVLGILPACGGEAPRSSLGRSLYAATVLALIAAELAPPTMAAALTAMAALATSLSSLRSLWYSCTKVTSGSRGSGTLVALSPPRDAPPNPEP